MTGRPDDAPRARQLARAAILIVLLLGPSLALETWARNEVDLVPYFQSGYRYQLEGKLLMFDRVACPAAVAVGTSMTEVALNGGTFEPYAKQTSNNQFSPVFTFAAPGTRPLAMLGVWREIRASGCTPKTLFVEVTPVILNIDRGEEFERGFMDWRMQLDISEERFDSAAYSLRFRFDLATWWRSFAYRNREPILQYLKARFGAAKPLKPIDPIPGDGNLHVTSTKQLEGAALTALHRVTRPTFVKREFKYRFSPAYPQAILLLLEEAQAAGTRVVLHTPPVPEMFHEFMGIIDATRPFCDFYDAATARADVRWYSEHRTKLPTTEFSDWLHLNRDGAIRYATRLLTAVAADAYPRDRACRGPL